MLWGKTRMNLLWIRTMTIVILLSAGCTFNRIIPTTTPQVSDRGWTDENSVMNGICFESAFDAVGRVFILRNETELSNFFDLADNSRLCRRPVKRQSFDFSGGRILVGLWSKGIGCTARHDVAQTHQDDEARRFTMTLNLIIEGTCNYELVRPFWIGLSGVTDYEISLVVE